ncbi:Excinuclease ABC, C subunit, N-terminal [Chitinispirillum alkaliphilum]|nr:Excinuclease ABC, C subunit, N-terminal [Chitinispirillum alkaliphilum]
MYTVYILYSETAHKYYIGHTVNLPARLQNHNSSEKTNGKFTRKNGPWKIVYTEEGFASRSLAMQREKTIKSWKSRKKIDDFIVAQSAESRWNRD